MKSYYTYIEGMMSESEGPKALQKFIRTVGAPFAMKNDNFKMQTGKAFMNVLNLYCIGTEPLSITTLSRTLLRIVSAL